MARWRGWWLVCPLVAGCLGVSLGPFTPHTAHAAPSLTSRAPLRPRLSASPPPPPPPPGDELSRAADLRNWRSFRARLVQRDKSAPLPPHQPQQTQSQQTRPDTWAGGWRGRGGEAGGGCMSSPCQSQAACCWRSRTRSLRSSHGSDAPPYSSSHTRHPTGRRGFCCGAPQMSHLVREREASFFCLKEREATFFFL